MFSVKMFCASLFVSTSAADLSEMLLAGTKEYHNKLESSPLSRDFYRGIVKKEVLKVGFQFLLKWCSIKKNLVHIFMMKILSFGNKGEKMREQIVSGLPIEMRKIKIKSNLFKFFFLSIPSTENPLVSK